MAIPSRFWFGWFIVILVAGTAAYAGLSFKQQESVRLQLNNLLEQTIEEKDQLQSTIESMELQLREKDAQLSQLADAQSLRQSLLAAQASLENINKELDKVNRERSALQEANFSATSRLQNITKEYTRTLDELKKSKDDIARLNREMNPDKKKIDEANRIAKEKTQELAEVQAESARQKKVYEELLLANKGLEKKIKELESARTSVTGQMEKLEADVASQGAPLRDMRASIEALKLQLSRKDEQVRELEAALAKSGKSSPGQDSQDRRLSDILVKKEIELESVRKDALDSKEKMVILQSRISDLENTIASHKQSQDRSLELESESLELKAKLAELQSSMNKKSELTLNLQRNMDYLNQELTKNMKEKKELEAKLSSVESNAMQDLEKERARFGEVNTLYNSIKTQISQFSTELEQRNKDLYAVREELTSLKSRSMILENDLAEAKDRQRKTMDDLIAAVRLNSILQDRITGGATVPYADSRDRDKADELRRKIEVILVNPKQ